MLKHFFYRFFAFYDEFVEEGSGLIHQIKTGDSGDLVSGMARTTEALLSAVLIAAGVAIALML